MPQYLISSYLPDDFDPSSVTEATIEAIHALNREMIAAGVRKFACGLSPKTTTLRSQANGEVIVTDGPYLETKEHVGGLWILETESLDQALAWVRKGAQVLQGVVEVREIFFNPAPEPG
ncbi:MAG TPA: YciI family protein [Dyella sp.]|uniref:YciI family protein n=1 Tax=Dyella sp. TaxID=1869338 RepID=UPI002C635D0E|nr:YciI family protein [Dyella sp.]HTV87165.1 YciI family protein [Dyella sp.]